MVEELPDEEQIEYGKEASCNWLPSPVGHLIPWYTSGFE